MLPNIGFAIFLVTVDNLRERVAGRLKVSSNSLLLEKPPVAMPHAKVTILRVLHVWLFHESIIKFHPKGKMQSSGDSSSLSLSGPVIKESHLEQVLSRDRHPFDLKSQSKATYSGEFAPISEDVFNMTTFENRLLSFGQENGHGVISYATDTSLHLYVPRKLWTESESLPRALESLFGRAVGSSIVLTQTNGNSRGRKGRACGLWQLQGKSIESVNGTNNITFLKFYGKFKPSQLKRHRKFLHNIALDLDGVKRFLSCSIEGKTTQKRHVPTRFLIVSGGDGSKMSRTDMSDLFATPDVSFTVQTNHLPQVLTFKARPNAPLHPLDRNNSGGNGKRGSKQPSDTITKINEDLSWNRPLLVDIPEGARLLSVLASGRRKEHLIRFQDSAQVEEATIDDTLENDYFIDINLSRQDTKISQRWRRIEVGAIDGRGPMAYVPENCVPSAAVPTNGAVELFACCANALNLKDGSVRVEGLTLLPPGRLYILLAFLSFGLNPISSFKGNYEEEKKEEDIGFLSLQDILYWLRKGKKGKIEEKKLEARISLAMNFNDSCRTLGEDLVCYPEKVEELCKIFDEVDGFRVEPWEGLRTHPLNFSESVDVGSNFLYENATSTKGNVGTFLSRKNLRKEVNPEVTRLGTQEQFACSVDAEMAKIMTQVSSLTISQGPDLNAAPLVVEPLRDHKSKNSVTVTQQESLYKCLACNYKHRKWGKCWKHLGKCCPRLLTDTTDLKERCLSGSSNSGSTGKSMDANVKELGSNEGINILSDGTKQPSMFLRSENKTVRQGSKYSCMSCGAEHQNWESCWKHMMTCCPELFDGSSKLQKLVVSRKQSNTGSKYGCLVCDYGNKKWTACLEHMVQCCPSILNHADGEECTLQETPVLDSDAKLLAPIEKSWILSDDFKPRQGGALEATSLEKHSKSKSYYNCVACETTYNEWDKCMEHMMVCCPHTFDGTSKIQERCVIMNSKEQLDKKKNRYNCLNCGYKNKKWSNCVEHMTYCCPSLLRNGVSDPKVSTQGATVTIPQKEYAGEVSADSGDLYVGSHESMMTLAVPKKDHAEKKSSYPCVVCWTDFGMWGECMDHMLTCCPEFFDGSSEVQVRSSVGSSKRKKKKYSCVGCAFRHKKWSVCLEHMVQCCPSLLKQQEFGHA